MIILQNLPFSNTLLGGVNEHINANLLKILGVKRNN
jgi:hypothetical protein